MSRALILCPMTAWASGSPVPEQHDRRDGPGSGNVISGNEGHGIDFHGGQRRPGHGSRGQLHRHRSTGTLNLGNAGTGIVLWSNNITIGGTTAGAGNVIANNGKDWQHAFIFDVYDNAHPVKLDLR